MPDVLVTPDVLLMGDSDVESADSTPNGWVPPRVEKAYDNWQYAGRQKMERITGAIQKAMIETPAIDYAELVSTRDGIWTFFHDKKNSKSTRMTGWATRTGSRTWLIVHALATSEG